MSFWEWSEQEGVLSGLLLLFCIFLLFFKAFAFGLPARDIIKSILGKKHFKKEKIGNFFTRYLFIPYRKILPRYIWIFNILLPVNAVFNVIAILCERYLGIKEIAQYAVMSSCIMLGIALLQFAKTCLEMGLKEGKGSIKDRRTTIGIAGYVAAALILFLAVILHVLELLNLRRF